MSQPFFEHLKALCDAENWSGALALWSKADAQQQLNPIYVFSGMQLAAALWRPDIQDKACAKLAEMSVPAQGLLQVLQSAAYFYQYNTIRSLIRYALENNCCDQTTILPMGALASRFNAVDLAVQCYDKAAELGIDAAIVAYNRATMALFTGDKAQCEKLLKTCLSLNPKMIEAHYTLANLKTWSTTDNHTETLKSLLPSTLEITQKAQLFFALAKEYEDCAKYDEAFEAMQSGAKLVKQSTGYDVQVDKLFLQTIASNYPLTNKVPKLDSSCTPLFICGLPRTGSTLFEKMLAQHSMINSAGELNQFADLFMRRANKQFAKQQLSVAAMVEASTKLDYASLGRDYLYSLDPQQTQTHYMIDKMPQNSLFVGPILSALPQAKVIIVDRHPLDACVAMYKQIFQGIYEFSYDLDDLGVYVSQMKVLMQHWHKSYPDNVFVISYEDLVNNTEHTLRAACRFLNIDFETECLQQHTSADVSTTASAAQVREKVYSSSIGKWQAYEKHLGVLEKYFPQ